MLVFDEIEKRSWRRRQNCFCFAEPSRRVQFAGGHWALPPMLLVATLWSASLHNAVAQTPSPPAAEAFGISGWVHGADNKPVANAMVGAYPLVEGGTERVVFDKSDSAGAFALSFLPSVDRQAVTHLWAYASGHGLVVVDWRNGNTPSENGVIIHLPASESVRFRVLAPHNGPLAGALVYPMYVNVPRDAPDPHRPRGPVMSVPKPFRDELSKTTDAYGMVDFDAVPKALFASFAVESLPYGVQCFAKSGGELVMERAATIGGRLIGPDLARYAGTSVVIESATRFGYGGYASTTLDERGAFRVPAIAGGPLRLRLDWDPDADLHPVGGSEFTLSPEAILYLKIETRATATISGKVLTGDTRAPVAGAAISLIRADRSRLFSNTVTTDETGRYTAKVVAGDIIVQLYTMGSRGAGLYERYDYPQVIKHQIAERDKVVNIPDMLLPPAEFITGTVEDAQGMPLAGCMIGFASLLNPHVFSNAESLGDGTFRMRLSNRLMSNLPQIKNGYGWVIIEHPGTGLQPPVLTKLEVLHSDGGTIRLRLPDVAAGPNGGGVQE